MPVILLQAGCTCLQKGKFMHLRFFILSVVLGCAFLTGCANTKVVEACTLEYIPDPAHKPRCWMMEIPTEYTYVKVFDGEVRFYPSK